MASNWNRSNNRGNNEGQEAGREVAGWLNIYVPRADNKKSKVGKGIAVEKDSPIGEYLHQLLQSEGGIERFRKGIVIEYNVAEAAGDVEFAL